MQTNLVQALPQHGAPSIAKSCYVHEHQVADDVVGLYTPFNHEVTFLPRTTWTRVREGHFDDLHPQVYQDLLTRGFLVPEGTDAKALDRVAVPPMPGFLSLWLLLVKTCNMACRYCVVDAEEQTKQAAAESKAGRAEAAKAGPSAAQSTPATSRAGVRMTPEIATAGIEVFRKSLERHRQPLAKATIYGGEPLLNRPVLKHAIPLLRQMRWEGQEYPLQILCFTNGIVYDPSVTELFLEHGVSVGISLDGMKEHHDAARPLVDGSSTFDAVVASYKRYKEAGLSVGISCTIGKHNADHLAEIGRYFMEELGAPGVQFQTPIQMPGNKNPLYVNMADVADSAWDAFKTIRDLGGEEGLAMRRLSRFMEGKFHHRDCFAVGGELVVAADGSLGPCHNATIGGGEHFRGNVLDPNVNPERQSNFIEWHARMPVNMPGCHGCPAIGLCGGGCPYNALLARGSIWEKDPQQCGYMVKFLNQLLEEVWGRYSHSVEQGAVAPVASYS